MHFGQKALHMCEKVGKFTIYRKCGQDYDRNGENVDITILKLSDKVV